MLPPLRLRAAPRRHLGRFNQGRPDDGDPNLGSLLTGLGLFILAISAALYFVAQAGH